MSEAGCTELGNKSTASSQHGHRVLADVVMASTTYLAHTTTLQCKFSGCDNIPLHMGHVSKSMTEMTCVGANAGSFLPGAMVFIW